ncbi:MAG: aspartate 1-decarboxylase [Planctomycetaceae bacterium]|jgi:aspartate 1-decarboxylase|nr:aspartate 1-decarboxylase [Planctomycetaceae bacterium]
MLITVLKSKIHRATLTATELGYEGSIAIDKNLLDSAGIFPGEQVHVLNISNGSRLITYAILAAPGSGTVMLNGPAAREGYVGDKVVIISYCHIDRNEISSHVPTIIKIGDNNQPIK